jgi:hypothetical protein
MAIVDRGSVVGLFITLCGIAVAIVLVVYAVSFYDDYKLFTISQASDAVGSNNDNTMKVIPMGFDRVGDNIVQGLFHSSYERSGDHLRLIHDIIALRPAS